MPVSAAYAVVAVRYLDTAIDWYARLLGREPDARPMPGLAEWYLGSAGVQLVEDVERCGRGLLTLRADDLELDHRDIARRGIDLGPITRGDQASFTQTVDPDGNCVTLVGAGARSS